ncbi:hypothetical protein FRY74_12480 [Vicingus serpentipes]|jgi:hypothetical protein|uniref:Uncharacterized protein n=1 Tax=Vicingus serpentipes TaxID=1926625 RepID=A0A5C6RQL6_9FLAO|nr:hypothetical protein [Vicingus serpentipes]TXB63682.1 hypothetical protein FRY74_12480 [Vicingus serpentipes]
MQTFTHLDFLQLTSKEKKLKSEITENVKNVKSPKQQTINNILNYSKALSIRESKHIEHIEIVLN